MAKFTKRSDGRYQQTITIGRHPDGKPIRKYFYADTVKELKAKCAQFEIDKKTKGMQGAEIKFAAAADLWLNKYKYMQSTKGKNRYERVVALHLAPLSNLYLKELKPVHLQSVINDMAKSGYSKQTLREIKQTAVQIINMAVDNNYITRNVFERIVIPNIEAKERLPISREVQQLIETTWREHRMGMPALIMLYCGLRKGELLALEWRDVDLLSKQINITKAVTYISNQPCIKKPKTKDGIRTVPIPDILLPVLEQTYGTSDMPVCPTIEGKIMSEIAFRRAWESYQHFLNIKAGGRDASRSKAKVSVIEPFTAHQLRHTYATILYDAGVDALAAQRFLGHADIETTLRIYTHLTKERQSLSLDALNDKLQGIEL